MAKERRMALKEELKEFHKNILKDSNLLYEKIKIYPLISLLFITAIFLLIALPHWQVSGINNVTEKVTLENQSRATLAQVLGGVAIGVGLYYTWRRINIAEEDLKVTQENLKIAQDNLKVTQKNLEATQKVAQDNLKVAQEGQITERFTRAIEQLGSEKMEIRLGGIYALERISEESEKDYWPIMEILTAYLRKNSSAEIVGNKNVSSDVQAVLMVITRREFSFNDKEPSPFNLRETCLREADLSGAHLEGANLRGAHLEGAELLETHLEEADLREAHFEKADLFNAFLEGADLTEAHLEEACLSGAHLEVADLTEAYLEGTDLRLADLNRANLSAAKLCTANLQDADLKGAKNLTIDQLSKVKTLYNTKLDPELEKTLKENYSHLFEEPKDGL